NCGVSLGFARILKIHGCIHDGWLSFEIKDNTVINQIFLLKLINTITSYLRNLAPEGTQPNLNTGIMKDLRVIVPPVHLQQRFATITDHFTSHKNLLHKQLDGSSKLFQSLIDKHLS